MSRQVAGLEREIGQPLFRRGVRRLDLTAAGTRLLRTVQPRLAAFARTHEGIDIRIDAVDEVRDLQSEGIDLALRLVPSGSAAAGGTLIVEEEPVAVTARRRAISSSSP